MHRARPVTTGLLYGYGVGSLGTGMFSAVPGVLLLYFMTDTLGIRVSLATFVVLAPRIWDAITDPLMGIISDRTRSPWGPRSPYLLAGAIGLGITFPLLFSVPASLSPTASAGYVLAIYILVATAFTLYQIPYVSLAAELDDDPFVRTRILAYRMAFVTLGLGLGTVAAPMLVTQFGGGRTAYAAMAASIGVPCGAAMLVSFFATHGRGRRPDATPAGSVLGQLRRIGSNRFFLALVCVYLVALTGMGAVSAAIPYFVGSVLGQDETAIGVIFLALLGSTFCSLPLWRAAAGRFGKRGPMAASLAIFGCGAGAAALSMNGDALVAFSSASAFAGIGFGGVQLLAFSMLTDVIRWDEGRGGGPAAGAYSGAWLVIDKLGPAVGSAVTGALLSLGGYVESVGGADQPASAIAAIQICVALPVASSALAVAALRFYRLGERDIEPRPERGPSS
jgi:Na+/melibiose symporter-like transporter